MSKILKFRFRKRYAAVLLLLSYIVFCQSCMTMRTSARATKQIFENANVDYIDSTAVISGNPIHYVETGNPDNPTLLFIHGSPGSWDAFQRYLTDSLLLKKYRMISIDRPGFGYSDFGKAENLQTQSDWISAFIKTIRNDKPLILVGHSLGGPVVTKLATENPDWYKHLVILAGSVDPDSEKPEKWRSFIMQKPIRYLIPGALRPANDELWYLKKDLLDMKPDLKKITSGITIIHGTKDPLVPFSNVQFLNANLTGAKTINTIVIDNANHFIPWEHFEEIRNALLDLKM